MKPQNIQESIQQAVDQFAVTINDIALQAVHDALGSRGVRLGTGPQSPTATLTAAPAARAPRVPRVVKAAKAKPVKAAANGADRKFGAKRTPEEIAETKGRFLDYVTEYPGRRIEHITTAINYVTADLQVPIKQLVAAGDIKVSGERRATRYWPKGIRPSQALIDEADEADAGGAAPTLADDIAA